MRTSSAWTTRRQCSRRRARPTRTCRACASRPATSRRGRRTRPSTSCTQQRGAALAARARRGVRARRSRWWPPAARSPCRCRDNFRAPSHTAIADLAQSARWRARLGALVRDAAGRGGRRLLSLARAARCARSTSGRPSTCRCCRRATDGDHPVAAWTKGTWLVPFMAALAADAQRAFGAEYDARLALAYPPLPDGRVAVPVPAPVHRRESVRPLDQCVACGARSRIIGYRCGRTTADVQRDAATAGTRANARRDDARRRRPTFPSHGPPLTMNQPESLATLAASVGAPSLCAPSAPARAGCAKSPR